MSEAGENSDEEYYAEESFEEDSQSEVEDQVPAEEEEEVEEEEECEDEDEQNVETKELDPNIASLLEESDTQSESDMEAEFLRGNPHARRQMAARFSGGFNRDRMVSYMSSSSEDESQVVITKTVAEVNQLSLRLDTSVEDETPSVRTLMPGSAHSPTKDESEDEDDGEDDEDAEVEEVEEEEELQGDEDDAQSDGTMDSNDGRQPVEGSDEEDGTDVEVEQLEEDEPLVTAVCKKNVQLPQEDIVSLVDASDNSSEHSVVTMGAPGDETDVTLADDSPRFRKQHPETETESKKVIERTDPEEHQMETPIQNLIELADASLAQQPDLARVRYLEQQMTQMSEIIMKSFQINGGAPNSQAFEQLAMATELMQQRSHRLEETESEMASMTESAMTSPRSLGGGRPPIRMHVQRSQEALVTTRSSRLVRPKCRCPSESDLLVQEQELEMGQQLGQSLEPNVRDLGIGMGEGYFVDECGQGDGLMRHPQQRKPPESNRRANSGTPSSFNSDACEYPINVSRSRCSNDKVNYKNAGRKSYSFTNPQLREIERQNQILLRKMMTVKPTATIKASTSSLKFNAPEKRQQPPAPRLSSAAVNRKKFQRQVDLDNDLLKRKLEAIGTRRPQFK
ncbi:protein hemingway isoform X2 [Drosophila elegans]|uniref:protein hemingway isoform X2 n=1 Tax=Drosophila elegans TaxID=30023 RepID=UPI0007E7950F|nr:protein hemingway isoform X2 [Drosophila elegans]